jgi:hypothetical protein|nr:MAG TPA: hypothetical protein [Siphoviridae sp. ctTYz13]
MIYKGEFRDIKDNLYTVKITTEGTPKVKNITLGGTPFVVNMEGDKLFKSAKYSGATLAIVSDDYLFDIYSGKNQGTKVELIKGNQIEWVGYVTPNLYDMGFNKFKELIEIECIDALSTLQYKKYQTPQKNVVSFQYLINKLIKECNAYKGYYFSTNFQIDDTKIDTIIDKLFISEQNFFDKKKDNESDNDVAWTCQEILEEICQYLNVTAIAYQDYVYFISYEAIKNNNFDFYKYTLDENDTPIKVNLLHSKLISGGDYSNTDNTLSIDEVFNKISVKDEFYTFDSIIPDFYENAFNITSDEDVKIKESNSIRNGMYGEVVKSKIGNGNGSNNNMIVLLDIVENPDGKHNTLNVVFSKYFSNPYYKFYKYDIEGNDITDKIKTLNYSDTKNMHGATIAKFCVKKLDKGSDIHKKIDEYVFKSTKNEMSLDKWLTLNDFSKVDFSNYIMLLNPIDNHISNENITNYPYFETTLSDTSALFGGENSYLLISGNYNYHYFDNDPYPIPDGESDISEGRYAMDEGDTYILAKLKWGEYYWSGDVTKGNKGWLKTETTFKIPYIKFDAGKSDRRADETMFKDIKIINNVNWRIGTNEEGYLINLPSEGVISGLPKLTIFKPFDPNYHSAKSNKNKGQFYKHCCVFLKNFIFKAIITDPTFSDLNETYTIYTNIINDEYVSEFEDVKFKICTNDGKKPNYNSVAKLDNGKMEFLNQIYNISTRQNLRSEEHYIFKIVNQYKTPSIVLNLNLRNEYKIYGKYRDTTIKDREFAINSLNIDYKNNATNVNLIELK